MGPKSGWGGVDGYLRPDQFLDHLTVIIIGGDEILQLKLIEIGVRERVLAAPQPTGGRDWFAKTSPRKHSNITIVVLQHNNTI